jgi:hypothetical protein
VSASCRFRPTAGKAAQTAERILRMKMFVTVVCVFALLVNLSGCGSSLKGEAEVKELIKLQKEGEELAKKDPMKALDLLPKMMEITSKIAALKLTDDDIKKLKEKYPDWKPDKMK